LTEHVLWWDSYCRFVWWWLRFDVIQDLLNYVWVSNVSDNAHGATTQWTYGNINIKDSFERFAVATLSPGQGSE